MERQTKFFGIKKELEMMKTYTSDLLNPVVAVEIIVIKRASQFQFLSQIEL